MGARRIFKSRRFARFARSEGIPDSALRQAVERAERGQIGADLGGGVIKQRIARRGEGKAGGYRTLIFFRSGTHAFFVHGFAKSDQANIGGAELADLKVLARTVLAMSEDELRVRILRGDFEEVQSAEDL